MAVLNEKQREESATIGKNRYPINDKAHARAALARINQGRLSESQKEKVRAKAHRMLGEGHKEERHEHKRGEYGR
jgi:hypothetical protein